MREQIRLWFYSQLFMSVVITGKAPFRSVLGYEKMLDETGREMHGSWGNLIRAEEAFERMGADVMRYQFCAQPPDRNLLFGYGPANEIRRRLLTLWNSVRFLVDYANIEGWRPSYATLASGPAGELRPLDRWLVARAGAFVTEARAALDAQLTHRLVDAFEAYVDDLSNWYIRRSRRRFYEHDEAAFSTLWYALVQGLRGVAVVMPFLAEHLWQNLVAGACEDAPASIHLAGWPEPAAAPDETLLREVDEVRRVVALGRRARESASLRLRQPLRRLVVQGAGPAAAHEDEIARRAAREGGRVRAGRGGRGAREAEPAGAGAAARGGAARRARGARRGAVRAARGRALPRRRARARPGRGARRSAARVRAGRSPRRTGSPSPSRRPSIRSSSARAACWT